MTTLFYTHWLVTTQCAASKKLCLLVPQREATCLRLFPTGCLGNKQWPTALLIRTAFFLERHMHNVSSCRPDISPIRTLFTTALLSRNVSLYGSLYKCLQKVTSPGRWPARAKQWLPQMVSTTTLS